MKLFLASSLQTTGSNIAKTLLDEGMTGRLMFMTTASEGEEGDLSWLDADRLPLVNAGLDVFDYSVTNKTEQEVIRAFEGVGAVCVAGGNTYYLLHYVRKSGFDKVVTRLVSRGLPYIGSSAGALLAGPTIETSLDDPRLIPELINYTGLNLSNISIRPHWGSEHFVDRYKSEFARLYGLQKPMILLTDKQYVIVEDDKFKIVSV